MITSSFILNLKAPFPTETVTRFLQARGYRRLESRTERYRSGANRPEEAADFLITDDPLLITRMRPGSPTCCILYWVGEQPLSCIHLRVRGYLLLRAQPDLQELLHCLNVLQQRGFYASPELIRLPDACIENRRRFSKREQEVLFCLAQGLENDAIAARLAISPTTITSYFNILKEKLQLSSVRQLVVHAVRMYSSYSDFFQP